MNLHEKARRSALYGTERGHAVFPLSISKTPAIKSPHDGRRACKGECGAAGHGVHDATTDPAVLRWLFDQAPRATGYGIACGRLVGLDLDRKNGVDGVAALNQLAAQHGFTIPRTLTVCTPTGGYHLWLSVPDAAAVPNSAGRLGPGIDVRGTGGYLVGPGSTGRAGEYALHPALGEIPVQPVPEQLLTLMQPPAAPPRRAGRQPVGNGDAALTGLLRVVLTAPEGTRNDRLYWAAAKAWAHVSDGHVDAATAETSLIDAAVASGLAEAEARRTITSAQRARLEAA